MPIHNNDIAAIFEELADLLEIQGANTFRVRAYRRGALGLRDLGRNVGQLLAEGEDLTTLPWIGEELAQKVEEILRTGRCRALEKLHDQVPSTLLELLDLPGLGPKRVHTLHQELGIRDRKELLQAIEAGRVRELAGFGRKLEARIREALETQPEPSKRFPLARAAEYTDPLLAYLRQLEGVEEVVAAGSYRRCKESVGDIDILAVAAEGQQVSDHLISYEEVAEVISHGSTRSTVHLRSGLQVDLRVVPRASFGAALQYFTGGQAHNIGMRRMAQDRGYKINEYGVFDGDQQIAGLTEKGVYASVGLSLIPPELREDRGEFKAAAEGSLPQLIERSHLRGDLHSHTTASDGHHSLEEMAEAARQAGLNYLAITDHSVGLRVANGLSIERLEAQMEAIDRLNEALTAITLLKGSEVEIDREGNLDFPDAVLAKLDLVIGAVHSHFDLSAKEQTERILRAMENPHLTFLAHPTGRRIPDRSGMHLAMEQILQAARQRGCFLEVNANPKRLDLNDIYARMAKEEGVRLTLDSDSHSNLGFHNLDYGVGQARRGWLEAEDVVNTRPLNELKRLIRETRLK